MEHVKAWSASSVFPGTTRDWAIYTPPNLEAANWRIAAGHTGIVIPPTEPTAESMGCANAKESGGDGGGAGGGSARAAVLPGEYRVLHFSHAAS